MGKSDTAGRPLRVGPLLGLRSLAELQNMDDSGWERLLGELLARPASASVWEAVYALFASWPEGSRKSAAVARTELHLEAWDEALRSASAGDVDLFEAGSLSSLATLVRRIEIHRRVTQGSNELEAVARSPRAERLTQLDIGASEIHSFSWRQAVTSEFLAGLTSVSVRGTVLTTDDLNCLFNESSWSKLVTLRLINVCARPRALEYTSAVSPFPQLRTVDLSRNHFGNEGGRALLHAPWLASVESLVLRDNGLSAKFLTELLDAKLGAPLKVLEVGQKGISAAAWEQLQRLAQTHAVVLGS